jgi:DNA-directed RNA polymerase subunit RPC12/RpoP
MKVVCENCGANYTVPDHKLTKPMNKATCKACNHKMLIPRPTPSVDNPDEKTLIRDQAGPGASSPLADADWKSQPSVTPEHSPLAPQTTAPDAFDPSGDLAWAGLGAFVSLLGAILLAMLSLIDHDGILWAGLAFAFGGSLLTLSVLATGQRGRMPANTLLSVSVAFVFAIFLASTLTGSKVGGTYVAENYEFDFIKAKGASEPLTPEEEDALAGEEAVVEEEATDGDASPDKTDDDDKSEEQEEAEEEAPEEVTPKDVVSPKPPPQPAPTTTPARPSAAPAPAPQPTPAPRPAPQAAPAPAPVAAPPPAPAPAMQTVPFEVIQSILWNNAPVKRCFVPLIQSGNAPPRVDVQFNLMSSGGVSNISVVQPQFSGTPFESCLKTALGKIQFPAAGGAGQRITFPFMLQ